MIRHDGYLEVPRWDVSLRKAQHEPIISFETYQRIKDRLNGVNRLPKRKNLNEDFPLRGYVICNDCETPLTACWSTGMYKRYPYYLCPKRGCASYGKSINREKIEGEFETLLQGVQPSQTLFTVAQAMFADAWARKTQDTGVQTKAFSDQISAIDKQIDGILDRIVQSSVPTVISRFEERVRELEEEKLRLVERKAQSGQPASNYEDTLRTALAFLANPWNLWKSDRLEDRKKVLKLTFADRLRYERGKGFRTANLALPFKLLGDFSDGKKVMAPQRG